jgi:hypothetical protein
MFHLRGYLFPQIPFPVIEPTDFTAYNTAGVHQKRDQANLLIQQRIPVLLGRAFS